MKKFIYYAASIAALGLSGCTQDLLDGTQADNGKVKSVTINLSAPDNLKSRAEKNGSYWQSDRGGITNSNGFADCKIRYTVGLFEEDGTPVGEPVVQYSADSKFTTNIDVVINKTYKIVAFADFCDKNNNPVAYNCDDLTAITMTSHDINQENQDAYFKSFTFTAGEDAVSLKLQRPLAKLRVIKRDSAEDIADEDVEVTYVKGSDYTSFDAVTGDLTAGASEKTDYYKSALPVKYPEKTQDGTVTEKTLFTDYIFAGTAVENYTLSVKWTQNGVRQTALLNNIPVKRNSLTTVYLQNPGGDSNQSVQITIEDDFEDGEDKNIGHQTEQLTVTDAKGEEIDLTNLDAAGGEIIVTGDKNCNETPEISVNYGKTLSKAAEEDWVTVSERSDDASYTISFGENETDSPRYASIMFVYKNGTQTIEIAQATSAISVTIDITELKNSAEALKSAINEAVKAKGIDMPGVEEADYYKQVTTLKLIGSTTGGNLNGLSSAIKDNENGMGKLGIGSLKYLDMKDVTFTSNNFLNTSLFFECKNIENITLPDVTEIINATCLGQLLGYKGALVIPEKVTTIGKDCFRNLGQSTDVQLYLTCKPVYMGEDNAYAFNSLKAKVVYFATEELKEAFVNPCRATFDAIDFHPANQPEAGDEGEEDFYKQYKWCTENKCPDIPLEVSPAPAFNGYPRD